MPLFINIIARECASKQYLEIKRIPPKNLENTKNIE